MGDSCLTEEMKTVLKGLVKETPELAVAMVTAIPLCSGAPVVGKAAEAAKRSAPALWDAKVTYYDAVGNKKEVLSISKLVQELGFKVSGSQALLCDPEGKACKATSVPEILKLQGYTVWGNGEGAPIEKGVTKHFTVFHPEFIAQQAKAAAEGKELIPREKPKKAR